MLINGHLLPSSFMRAVAENALARETGSWQLKENLDSFGGKLETEIGHVFATEPEITKNTNALEKDFIEDGIYGHDSDYSGEPGFIEDITDFSGVVAFAIAGDGAPFCFDYRGNDSDPEIIWWDDVYWRKISNNFDEFVALFETNS